MNILFVATGYPERGKPTTGFPNYLYRVSLSLIQLGHKPVILTSGNKNEHRVEQGIEILTVQIGRYADCGSKTINYTVNALYKSYILNQRIKKMTKERNIDIIQFTSLEGIAMLYRGSIPAVLRLSSYAKTYFATYQTLSKANVKMMSLYERLSSQRCNAVIAPCRNTAEAFGKDCNRKVKVIESPFVNDVQEYDSKYVDEDLKGKKFALFFGVLYAEKGIYVISGLLEQFLRDNSDYYFVFIGDIWNIDGKDAAQIIKKSAGKYADRVMILNAMPHKQLYPVIKQADFIVLPSFMENMSNACIESMYFEKVVIGTDGASFEQLITHGKSGLLCKIGDSKDLLDKMQMAASMTKEEKEKIGKQAKQRIDKLKPEYVVKKLVRLYEYVIGNSNPVLRMDNLYGNNKKNG